MILVGFSLTWLQVLTSRCTIQYVQACSSFVRVEGGTKPALSLAYNAHKVCERDTPAPLRKHVAFK